MTPVPDDDAAAALPRLTWRQALAWRLGAQLLDPRADATVEEVIGRLGALVAQPDTAPELSVGVRRRHPRPGEVAAAVADGRVIKTYAFRGATHVMTPASAADHLALRASSRMWELPSWRSYYGLEPGDWPALLDAAREALADGPLTRAELGRAITAHPRFRHLEPVFAEGAGTLLKPFAWQGVLSFGPPRGQQSMFQALDTQPRWPGLPPVDEAGPRAVEAYVRAYGPTTPDRLHYWLGSGLGAARKAIQGWITGLEPRLARVVVDGTAAFVMADDLEALLAAGSSDALRLLPGYDQWVLGPGTDDASVVPPAIRAPVSRGANLLVVGGVVAGTWTLARDEVSLGWLDGTTAREPGEVEAEVARVAAVLGRDVRLA